MFTQWLYFMVVVVGAGAYGPYYSNSSRTQTSSLTTSEACSGCSASVTILDVQWNPEIFYHTAATVILTPDNATNATRTSTIVAPSFVLPEDLRTAAYPVIGPVFSTDIAGSAYSLTYPTPFSGLGEVKFTQQVQETFGVGQTICTASAFTRNFLRPGSAQVTGVPEVPQSCSIAISSPSVILVQVSQMTKTLTRPTAPAVQFATGNAFAAPQPNPVAPIAKPTTTSTPEASSPSQIVGPVSITTIYSGNTDNSAGGSTGDNNPFPPDDVTSVDGILVEGGAPPAPIQQPIPLGAQSLSPAVTENGILYTAPSPNLVSSSPQSPPQPTNPSPNHASATLSPPMKGPPILNPIGGNAAAITAPPPPLSTLPLLAGAPAITLSGTTYSLSPSSSALIVNSNTLLPGGPPIIDSSGTTYSLASPPTALTVCTPPPTSGSNINSNNTTTLALPAPISPSSNTNKNDGAAAGGAGGNPGGASPIAFQTAGVIILPVGGSGAYLVNWKPLLPGGPAVTVNGQIISLQPGGTGVVVGSGLAAATANPTITGEGGVVGGGNGKTAAVTATGAQPLGSALGQAGLKAPSSSSSSSTSSGNGGSGGGGYGSTTGSTGMSSSAAGRYETNFAAVVVGSMLTMTITLLMAGI